MPHRGEARPGRYHMPSRSTLSKTVSLDAGVGPAGVTAGVHS